MSRCETPASQPAEESAASPPASRRRERSQPARRRERRQGHVCWAPQPWQKTASQRSPVRVQRVRPIRDMCRGGYSRMSVDAAMSVGERAFEEWLEIFKEWLERLEEDKQETTEPERQRTQMEQGFKKELEETISSTPMRPEPTPIRPPRPKRAIRRMRELERTRNAPGSQNAFQAQNRDETREGE